MTQSPKISVVGASNIDLISYVARLPGMGETLHGSKFQIGFGGKGANQAVMAAKLGGDVSMVTMLGRDTFGEDTLKNFQDAGIDSTHVLFTDKAFSGVAPIAVDPSGNNTIIIVTGANDLLNEKNIEAARKTIASSKIVVCQLEIPPQITLKALKTAREEGVPTILNPAPGVADLDDRFFALSTVFCPNETEAALLAGFPVKSLENAERAGQFFLNKGVETAIITLGVRGILFVTGNMTTHIPAEAVTAVDSTGAGDAFVGSLAYFLASDVAMIEAITRANKIAGISVQSFGTQTSFPDRKDLPVSLFAA